MTRMLLALLLTTSLHAGLVAAPERELAPRTLDAAAFAQTDARFAFDGERFLAVWWHSERAFEGAVHGAFLSREGKRIDTNTIVIAEEGFHPVVAAGDGAFLVAWETSSGVRARIVRSNGTLSDVIDTGLTGLHLYSPGTVRVAFHDGVFLVITVEEPRRVRGAVIDEDGHRTVGPVTLLSNLFGASASAELVVTSSGFVVVAAFDSVIAFPVSDEGVPGIERRLAGDPSGEVHATAEGDEIRVAWMQDDSVSTVRLKGNDLTRRTIDAQDRTLVDLVDDVLFLSGENSLVAMRTNGDVTLLSVAAPATVFDAASNGTDLVLLLGVNWFQPDADVYAGLLRENAYELVALSPRHQTSADVAAAGDAQLVAWAVEHGVEAMRVGDESTIQFTSVPAVPRVASNGTDWLVIWVEHPRIYGIRIAHNGSLLDDQPFVIAEGVMLTTEIAVAWDGTSYVVVFARGIPFRGITATVTAVRVFADGRVADDETALSDVANNTGYAIAGNGNGSLVVWQHGASVSGALLSPSDLVTPVTFPDPLGATPDVAWNGETYAIAYAAQHEIRWAFVNATGAVRAPFVSFASSPAAHIELEAFQGRFLLLFGNTSLHGLTFDTNGTIVDPHTILGRTRNGDFAASGSFVATTEGTPSIARIFTRTIESTPFRRTRTVRH